MEALTLGIQRAYHCGQRAMLKALEEPRAENFYEWRKPVKRLRHRLQILQRLELGKIKTTLRDFKSLAELLGLKNDLARLKTQLEHSRGKAKVKLPPAVEPLLQAREQALTQDVIVSEQRLYHRKANDSLRSR